MPIFTRHARASTLQIISARLSKNGTVITFASDTSLHRDTSTSWHRGLGRCAGFVFWFFAHDRYSHAGNCNGLLANTGLFLFTGDRYLFLLQCQGFPFDSRFSSPVSGVKISQSNFAIYTPLHHCLQIIGHRHLLMNLHVVQFQNGFELRTHVFSILYRLS